MCVTLSSMLHSKILFSLASGMQSAILTGGQIRVIKLREAQEQWTKKNSCSGFFCMPALNKTWCFHPKVIPEPKGGHITCTTSGVAGPWWSLLKAGRGGRLKRSAKVTDAAMDWWVGDMRYLRTSGSCSWRKAPPWLWVAEVQLENINKSAQMETFVCTYACFIKKENI